MSSSSDSSSGGVTNTLVGRGGDVCILLGLGLVNSPVIRRKLQKQVMNEVSVKNVTVRNKLISMNV